MWVDVNITVQGGRATTYPTICRCLAISATRRFSVAGWTVGWLWVSFTILIVGFEYVPTSGGWVTSAFVIYYTLYADWLGRRTS